MMIAATATGVQPFHARFNRRTFENAPPLAKWRCNLTGLSQGHNLYFVAYTSNIYVYIPQFPTQKISQNPVLVFTSQPSAPHLRGHIDLRNPHAINSLIVQYLGKEEVIATVRDDGDVDAFLLRHIVHAIDRRREAGSELGIRGEELRPFFQSNVGRSAWGLAIHAQARVLATSANTHEVRIFKFGLLQTDAAETSEREEDRPISDADSEDDDSRENQQRKTDVTYQILNGESNIPYIAFCNTGDDPEGRWLLTTDISGICQVMDLREMRPVQRFRFGRSFMNSNVDEERFDRLNAGWILTFLDRRSFQEEDVVDVALGLDESETIPDLQRNPTIWDISKTVQHLPGNSEPFIYHRPRRRREGLRDAEDDTIQAEDLPANDHHEQDDNDDDSETDDSSEGGAPLEVEIDVSQQLGTQSLHSPDHVVQTEPPIAADEDDPDETMSTSEWVSDSDSASASASDPDDDGDEVAVVDDAEDPEDEMTEDTIPFTSIYNGTSICANEPTFALNRNSFWDKLPCPILHASVRNIYLLQPFTSTSSSLQTNPVQPDKARADWNPPMVGLANPLRQEIQQDFIYLRMLERLNMMVSIPTLGIVIVASQKGRAVLLSLTKVLPSASYAPGKSRLSSASKDKTNYAMRVECILPFAQQEKANQRPFAPLHGIAASPLQGCDGGGRKAGDGGGSAQRWRLMMMYQDHSILSYEIGKKASMTEDGGGMGLGKGPMGVDVEALVV